MSTSSPPIERKVKAATIAVYIATSALLGILNGVTDANLVAGLPDWLEVFVAPLLPAAAAWIAGYRAKHTPRPDLGG